MNAHTMTQAERSDMIAAGFSHVVVDCDGKIVRDAYDFPQAEMMARMEDALVRTQTGSGYRSAHFVVDLRTGRWIDPA